MQAKYLWLILIILFTTQCNYNNKSVYQGYVESENVYLSSPYSGILKKLFIHRGQEVKKGQLLFQLDAEPQFSLLQASEAELSEAQNSLLDLKKPRRLPEISAIEAQISQTEAQLQLAKIRLIRAQKLFAKQAADKDSVDAALALVKEQEQLKIQYEANLDLAKLGSREEQIKAQAAKVVSLVAKLQEIKWELAQKTIRSPDDGIIFDNYYEIGEFVPNQQPVLSVLPFDDIYIEFFIPIENIAKVHVRQKINFSCHNCPEPNIAVIDYISPTAEYLPPLVYSRDNNDRLVFRIKAKINYSKIFKPGQPVEVQF